MTDTHHSGSGSFAAAPSASEISGAESAITSLMAAMRNYGLFPPDHTSTAKLLEGVQKTIAGFIERYGDLGFALEKTRALYEENLVFEGDENDENPIYVLYRDGIRWVQLSEGIDTRELEVFFRIFSHYRVMKEEPEDDLVSALWREDLRHILYLASDDLWDVEPVLDFSVFEPPGGTGGAAAEAAAAADDGEEREGWEFIRPEEGDARYKDLSVAKVSAGEGLWHLNEEEREKLSEDIRDCIENESREDIIGLMLLVLNRESEPESFESIIRYLQEEFRISLINKDFGSSFLLLGNVKKIQEAGDGRKEWAADIFDDFYMNLVKPEVLSTLIPVWHELSTLDPVTVKHFTSVLRLLPARAGRTFASMINKISSPNARSLMIEIIASFATRDLDVLEELLTEPEEDLGMRLIRIINGLEDRERAARLMRKAAAHPRNKVRNEAHKGLHRLGGL